MSDVLDLNTIKQEIIKSLTHLNPYKIILFGSYAYGTPTKDSDMDIVFIGQEESFFDSFESRIKAKKKILKAFKDLSFPVDVVNYTKGEWEVLIKNPSQFIKKIELDGVVIE